MNKALFVYSERHISKKPFREVRSYYLPHRMIEPFYRYKTTNNSWQDLRYANGTLEEWVKKSNAEIDEGIREIRELLDED